MFEIYNTKAAGAGVVEEIRSVANQQYARGMMLVVANGLAALATVSGKGSHLYMGMQTPPALLRKAVEDKATTFGEMVEAVAIAGPDLVLKSTLTGNSAPQINGVAANANAATNVVLATFASANGDYDGGTVYCVELDQQLPIATSTNAAGVITINTVGNFRRAVTTGDTIRAVPFSKGFPTVKFCATNPESGLGTLPADKTGGFNKIEDVDLKNLFAYSSCPNLV